MNHHTIQKKYIEQWKNDKNQLQIFSILENKYLERGSNWRGFWQKDFNVLNEKKHRYLPEQITSQIDKLAIEAIRKIDTVRKNHLSGDDRSAIAFCVALQYIRTPRHRDETNKIIERETKLFMREKISSPDKINITKEKILNHQPINKEEKDALDKISKMTNEEIQSAIFSTIHGNDLRVKLTEEGHSKTILKIAREAKEIFEFQWLFLVAPNDSPFITSDSPCFTISPTKMMNGLVSPQATVVFPLRPDLCLFIKPKLKSKVEHYMELDTKAVIDINKLIVAQSYHLVVAKEKTYLENLIRDYDVKSHKSSRDAVVYENGEYVMFNME